MHKMHLEGNVVHMSVEIVRRLPVALTRAPMRAVRPIMLRDTYAHPEKELLRMERTGSLVRIGHGVYIVKPDQYGANDPWKPPFEEAAMAYATCFHGDRVPVLVGIGAARHHHAIPRAIAATTIAVPAQRRPVALDTGGRIVFTKRDLDTIDARPEKGTIGTFLVATPEQTLVDLVARPDLGGMEAEAHAAVEILRNQVDLDRLERVLGRASVRTQRAVRYVLGRE